MSDFSTCLKFSSKGLILKIVGDMLVIETTDPNELRREVDRALGDELLSVRGAAEHLKVSTRTIRNRIEDGTLEAKQYCGSVLRIRKRDLEH